MSDSQTIIECDRCGAFRTYDPTERWTSHDCVTGRWGYKSSPVSTWVISQVCANCGGPASGFAMIDHHRYCHDGTSEMPPLLASANSCFALAWRTSARDEWHAVSFEVTSRAAGAPRVISTKMQYREGGGPAALSVSVDELAPIDGTSV